MSGGWQTQVSNQPAAAVAGNRASQNAIMSWQGGGPNGLVAAVGGCVVGRFAWVYPPTNVNEEYTQALPTSHDWTGSCTVVPAGLVPNDVQAQNSTFLSNAGMTILQGYQMYLVTQGDWWVVNDGTVVTDPGYSKAFADTATGKIKFANQGRHVRWGIRCNLVHRREHEHRHHRDDERSPTTSRRSPRSAPARSIPAPR